MIDGGVGQPRNATSCSPDPLRISPQHLSKLCHKDYKGLFTTSSSPPYYQLRLYCRVDSGEDEAVLHRDWELRERLNPVVFTIEAMKQLYAAIFLSAVGLQIDSVNLSELS